MKKREKKTKIKGTSQRLTRAERKKAKFIQKATEELQLCVLVGEFHKEYLEIDLGREERKLEKLEARLAKLRPKTQVIETVEQTEVDF